MAPKLDPALREKFMDLDELEIYKLVESKAAHENTRNFIVEFSLKECRIALDLDPSGFEEVLRLDNSSGSVRWINIWSPSAQPAVMETICSRYGFSKRMQALMVFSGRRSNVGSSSFNTASSSPQDESRSSKDVEKGLPAGTSEPPPLQDSTEAFDMYDLVRETMNYTSVDQGEHFLCIGANWLHRRPFLDRRRTSRRLVPPKHWSWLALTSDCTVLSFHDTPSFEEVPDGQDVDEWKVQELKNMRSNTLSVLLQLSKHSSERNILSLKVIRPNPKRDQSVVNMGLRRTSSIIDTEGFISVEGSSNLFYYLFEDYTAAVPILKEARQLLDAMSQKVLLHAVNHRHPTAIIPDIHRIGKELRQLQHLFECYMSLIARITSPRSVDAAAISNFQLSADVSLSPSARNRFERLCDRLQLFMLNTIQDYLEESSALSKTYFNLTAQVDSLATARLTRATTLLAKLSVFFLPITFMTSYFSVSIDGMLEGYTGTTYWVAFSIVAGVSFFGLMFFSRVLAFFSDPLEEFADNSTEFARKLIGRLGINTRREEDDYDD